MSQENVEIVKAIQPPTGTDLTALYADDAGIADRIALAAPLFEDDFEFEVHGAVGERRGSGLR